MSTKTNKDSEETISHCSDETDSSKERKQAANALMKLISIQSTSLTEPSPATPLKNKKRKSTELPKSDRVLRSKGTLSLPLTPPSASYKNEEIWDDPPIHDSDWIEEQMTILEILDLAKDSAGPTPRDEWVTWFQPGPHRPFEVLVAMMMTSSTREEQVQKAMENLRQADLLTPEKMIDADQQTLESCFKMSRNHQLNSIHRKISENILSAARKIMFEFDGKVPRDRSILINSFQGIGRKMAIVIMQEAFSCVDAGIAVDTHVKKISRVLKWIPYKTSHEDKVAEYLETWVPKTHWEIIHITLAGLGQHLKARKGDEILSFLTENHSDEICEIMKKIIKAYKKD